MNELVKDMYSNAAYGSENKKKLCPSNEKRKSLKRAVKINWITIKADELESFRAFNFLIIKIMAIECKIAFHV